MSAFKNDGTVQYGSKVLTIGSASGGAGGTAFVADNITVNRTSKTILRTDEIDEPDGQVSYKGEPDTGTAQVQLATSSTTLMSQGHEFTVDLKFGSEVYYVTDISIPFTKDGETKVNISFRELIN